MLFLLLACGRALTEHEPPADAAVQPPSLAGDSDPFYADGSVLELGLELSEASLTALANDPREWAEGALVYEGKRYGPVGVRIKGESSYRDIDQKPSFKVKFNQYDPDGRFLGMRRLVFNNMVSDPSMLRERLAYAFFRDRGAPAPRCNHVTLTVNGEPYGLYANVENTDEELIGRWFANREGSMWELHDADFRPDLLDGFQLEEGVDDQTSIEALTAVMATPEGPTLAWDYVERDSWFRYLTTMAYVGNLDGYPFSDPGDDAHLYLDPATGLFHFVPHGLDETFSDDAAVEYVMHGILATACIEDEACKAEWRASLEAAITHAEAAGLEARVAAITAEIDAAGDADTRKEYDNDAVDEGRVAVLAFIAARDAALRGQLTW